MSIPPENQKKDIHKYSSNRRTMVGVIKAATPAIVYVAVALIVLHSAPEKIQTASSMLASIDWQAMFSFGIFIVMIATAIRMASEPLFKYLERRKSIGHH